MSGATSDFLNDVSRRAIVVSGVVAAVTILAGTALTVALLREAALSRAQENLFNLAAALAEQTRRSIQSIDLLVTATAEDFGANDPQADAHALFERLRERIAALPELEGIAVIGPDGHLMSHSRRFPPPAANYADRDYFALHRDRRVEGLYVGAPVSGRLVPGLQQTYSRRIENRKGEFRGVVSGAVRLNRPHPFYESLRLGKGGRVSMFRTDGVMIDTHPFSDAAIGRSYATHPLFAKALAQAGSGLLTQTSLIDDDPRLIAYQRLRDYPIVVSLSSTERHALADWREGAVTLAVVAGGACLIILIAVALALRQQAQAKQFQSEIQNRGDRLLGIIHSAMDAIITIDERQQIVVFNEAAETIFRCKAAEALGGPLDRFIPERFRRHHRLHVERFGATRVSTRMMGARLQLFGLRADGEEFPIDASISQVTSGGEKFYTVILRDITTRVQAEQALEEANQRLRDASERMQGIIESAMDALITVDEDQRILLFNSAAERIFLCPALEAVGSSLDRFIPERFRAAHRAHIVRFGATGDTTRKMGGRLALFGLRSNGEEFPIDASISQVAVKGKKLFTVILRDVTERKVAEEALAHSYAELRAMSAAMNEVREAERTRIARELHDELAQSLTAVKMDVAWLAARLTREQVPLLNRTEKMRQLVDDTVKSVRRIASDLRPVMLDDLGLMPSIENLAHAFTERTGIAVNLNMDAAGYEFHDPLATAVYRIAQEALTNVARHAEATEVDLTVLLESGRLRVDIRDNGRGFTPDPAHKSYGILGIKERAQTIGGVAEIRSVPEGGTLVQILIPAERYMKSEMP